MDDAALLLGLRRRDSAAFEQLLDVHSSVLLRLARSVVRDPALAEEIVQETWLAVIDGIDGFEGRSSLRTWLCQIALNKARSRASKERQMRSPAQTESDGPTVDERRFDSAGFWKTEPQDWRDSPQKLLEDAEARAAVEAELAQMPENMRLTVTLRDIEGADAKEVCHVLGISETNQRQLLHRGRARLRLTLEMLDRDL